jgi:hypothetical protein
MVVKVSKPEINVREKISELDKPSGTAGQAMLAAETPQEQQALVGVGRRNLTINGDFRVNQRGILPVTNPTGAAYFTDRWLIGSTPTNLVISNETGVYINQDNAKVKTLKALFSGSGGFDIYQTYEDWEYLSNKTVTISFWYRTNIHNCVIRQWSTMSPATIPSTGGEWKKFSTTFTLGTLVAGARAANTATLGIWTSGATISSGSYFEFTQFQLEVSKVATPFEHRGYGEELALCQRYFQRLEWKGGSSIVTLQFNNVSGLFNLDYTRKRADPSFVLPTATAATNQANGISFLTSGGSYRGSIGTVTASHISRDSCRINFTSWGSSGSAGDATWAYFTTNTSNPELKCFIDIDAEL